MSIHSISWAWKQTGLSPTEKFILVALSDNSDDNGRCWPGMEFIAQKTGYSRRTVVTAISALQDKGLLSITRRNKDGMKIANVYNLDFSHVKELHSDVKELHNVSEEINANPVDSDVKELHSDVKELHNVSEEINANPVDSDVKELHNDVQLTTSRCETASHKPSINQPSIKNFVGADFETEVEEIKKLHLQTCGLSSVPPLKIVREILAAGNPVSVIEDVYQLCGGDVQMYRQRNIIQRLTAIRDKPPPEVKDTSGPYVPKDENEAKLIETMKRRGFWDE